jgi:hypothetical protein
LLLISAKVATDHKLFSRTWKLIPVCFLQALVDFLYGLDTPDSWYCSPEMESVYEAVTDVVAWSNDVGSFKRVCMHQSITRYSKKTCPRRV